MRFTPFLWLVPVALLASVSFVASNPQPIVEEREIVPVVSVTASGHGSKGPVIGIDSWSPAEPHIHPWPIAAQPSGHTTTVSKHNNHNTTLAERTTALLILCTSPSCSGTCYGYTLSAITPYTCYGTITFYSGYVSHGGVALPYGVYVGIGASCVGGVLIPFVDVCYNISPPGTTFFIN